jgi:hypothetical protein
VAARPKVRECRELEGYDSFPTAGVDEQIVEVSDERT